MINLTDNAKKHLDNYLQQIRTYLRGCKTVDADEVERNVIEHIESEFEGATAVVSFEKLDAVLQRLGSPRQWIPEEEIPWWRKMILRLRTGPEDWRLAYISFGLLIVGFVILPSFIVLIPASFIVARAALSESADPHELKAQKWLIYPPLIIVYVSLVLLLLLWPLALFESFGSMLENSYRERLSGHYNKAYEVQCAFVVCGLTGAATGLWWIILGSLLTAWPAMIRKVFSPFVHRFKRKWAVVIIAIGILLVLLCGFLAAIFNSHIPTQITTHQSACPLQ